MGESRYYIIIETEKKKTAMYVTLPNKFKESEHMKFIKQLEQMGFEKAIITSMVKLKK